MKWNLGAAVGRWKGPLWGREVEDRVLGLGWQNPLSGSARLLVAHAGTNCKDNKLWAKASGVIGRSEGKQKPRTKGSLWRERCAEQDLKRSQHWGFYCVGDDWTANVNSGRQLLRCWCFREMLSKYYRLGEWPPQGRLSGESLHNAKITKQKTHPHAFLFASKSRMQKPRDVRRLFQGVSRTKPLLADSTYRDLAWL